MDLHDVLQFFDFEHLTKPELRAISKPFGETARLIAAMTPDAWAAEVSFLKGHQDNSLIVALIRYVNAATPANPESTWAVVKISEAGQLLLTGSKIQALRRLLEAKDCAVRSFLYKPKAG